MWREYCEQQDCRKVLGPCCSARNLMSKNPKISIEFQKMNFNEFQCTAKRGEC